MRNENPATFMSNPESIPMGGYPPNITKMEQEVLQNLTDDFLPGAQIRDAIKTLSMHTINNALRRLLSRGLVERKEGDKKVLWRKIS